MKRWLTVMFLAACAAAAQQTTKTASLGSGSAPAGKQARVYVTDSDSWSSQSSSGGGYGWLSGGFGSQSSAGARPQTAEIIKTIGQRCPGLIVNNKPDASDYVIRLEHEGGKGLLRKKDKVAVFVRLSGDSIFSNSTVSLGGAVQGACAAVGKHWAANVASLAEPVIPPVLAAAASQGPTPSMASLLIESSAAGADIEVDGEFVGNTPSTLSVVPGKHTVTVKKKGFVDWTRTMTVSGSSVHLSADLTTNSGS